MTTELLPVVHPHLPIIQFDDKHCTLILDSSQITEFYTCPMQWEYSSNQRLEISSTVEKHAMVMGTYGHKLLEIYYKGRANSRSITDCREEALSYIVPPEYPLTQDEINLVKEKFSLYTYIYSNKDFVVNDPDTVEVGFSHKVFEDDYFLFILEGKIDIAEATMSGQKIFVDNKFQLRKHSLYKKSIQFRNYAMVLNLPLLLINYVRLTKKQDEDTFVRDIASFSALDHKKWRDELFTIYIKIASFLSNYSTEDTDHPSYRNRASCAGRFGYECQFTALCDEINLDVRKAKKHTLYQIKNEWKPW